MLERLKVNRYFEQVFEKFLCGLNNDLRFYFIQKFIHLFNTVWFGFFNPKCFTIFSNCFVAIASINYNTVCQFYIFHGGFPSAHGFQIQHLISKFNSLFQFSLFIIRIQFQKSIVKIHNNFKINYAISQSDFRPHLHIIIIKSNFKSSFQNQISQY